jgi:hypothetical protein
LKSSATTAEARRLRVRRFVRVGQCIEKVIEEAALDDVRIRPPSGDHERGGAPERDLHGGAATQKIRAGAHAEGLGVPRLPDHIHHAGRPPAVTRRIRGLVELHVLDGVGVEGAEDSEEVVYVVNGHAIQDHKILVGRPTPNEESRGSVVRAAHAR